MRTSRYSPPEKKDRAYREDHVVTSEYPHAFRRQWPRKKARSHRAYRRRVNQLLGRLPETHNDEDDRREDSTAESVRRTIARKDGVITLREYVIRTHERRVRTTAWNFFKTPYDASTHRPRFAAFLSEITKGDTPYLREVATFFGDMLDGVAVGYSGRPLPPSPRHVDWVKAFLRDEPDWEPRLRAWILRVRVDMPGGNVYH